MQRRRGFTLLELVLVVVALGVLGTIAFPHTTWGKQRAVDARLRADLVRYTEAQELTYVRKMTYAPPRALVESGAWGLTEGVEVDSTGVSPDGERLYLRVRHVATGRMCSVDYSRSSENAANRPQCFDGREDEVHGPLDTAEVPRLSTSEIEPPPPPPLPPADPGGNLLFPPVVSNPADVMLQPGENGTAVYQVTNRSTMVRSFEFLATSSHPGAVLTPTSPEAISILAGQTVPISVSSPGAPTAESAATAGGARRATDARDPSLEGTGRFSVSAGLALAAPALSSPADVEADPGEDVVIAWDVSNRTNAPRNLVVTPSDPHPAVLPRRAADLSGVSAFASSQTKAAAVTYRLADGAEGGQSYPVEISAHDQEDPTRSATDVVHVRARLILAAPSISVSPAGERTEEPGIPFTLTWTVRNESNAARLLELVPSADAGALELVSSEGAGHVTVPKRATATVTATYRVRPGATAPGRSLALLAATDVADSSLRTDARVAVNTALVRRAPSVSTPTDQTLSPGAALDVAWTVKNESNATRTLTISPSAGADLSVESATNSGTVTFAAGEEKTVTVRYRLAATSEAGTVRVAPLTVADQDGAPYTSSESFRVTTALVLAAPTVGAPIARTRTPGTSESVPFTVRNNSNATRTIELLPSSSSAAVAGVPTTSPASVTLPAWGSASVSLTYQVESQAPGGATTEIALQARDAGARDHAGAAGFTLTAATVLRAPTQSTPADQVRAQGESFTGSWTVSNPSNVARSYSITSAAAAGITITGGTNTGSVTVPAFGAITVTVNYSMSAAAEGGSSRTATLSTSDVGGAGAVSSSFTVRTADVEGCQDPDGQNFNPTANVAGSCTYSWGCMDPGSSNYDPLAKQDDGSCYVLGCTHSWADNYNRGATRDDGSCYKRGCTASWANNYDPQATQDNGTCYRNGCTTSSASNYDGLATRDDGSCYWLGCTDPNARNYSPTATRNDGSCVAHVDGCTDPRAVNYNAGATRDNGACSYTVAGCTASWADNFNPSATQDDGSCYKRGCMDASATNYDPKATTSEGATCTYAPPETRTIRRQQTATYYHLHGQYRATESFSCTVKKTYGGGISYSYGADCVSPVSGTWSHVQVGDNPEPLETRHEVAACIWNHTWCGTRQDFHF